MKEKRKNGKVRTRTERPGRRLFCLSLTAALCASTFSLGSVAFAGDSLPEAEETLSDPVQEAEETLEVASCDTAADAVLENYIKENVDPYYVPYVEQMQTANYLKVMNTMFDGAYVESGDTIDSIMDGIGNADPSSYNKFIASIDTKVALYDLCEESDYFVAFADTMDEIPNVKVFDSAFAVNDYSGTTVEGCFFDTATGLAYIPKSLYFDDEGQYTVGLIQLQLGQLINGDFAEVDAPVTSSYREEGEDEADVYETIANIFEMKTTARAEPGLSRDDITVFANGIPLEEDEYSYDPKTGEVTIPVSSSSVGSVSVVAEEEEPTLMTKLGSLFTPLLVTAYAEENTGFSSWDEIQYSNTSLIELPAWVTTGTALWSDSAYMYYSASVEEEASSSDWGVGYAFDFGQDRKVWGDDYVNDWDDSDNQSLIKWIWGDWGSQHLSSDPSYLVVQGEGRYFKFNMSMSTFYYTEEFKKSGDGEWEALKNEYNTSCCDEAPIGEAVTALQTIGTLYAQCSHVENGDEYITPSTWQQLPMLVRFVYFSEDSDGSPFAVLACVSSQAGGQTGFGLYKIHAFVASTGFLTVQKSAGDGSDILNLEGNPGYSLAGAEYTVYTDSTCTEIAEDIDGNEAVLVTAADGSTGTLELRADTYYVKETRAAPGYELDERVYEAEVTTGCTETLPLTVSSTDNPQYGYLELRKSSGNPGVTEGNAGYSLFGAAYGIYGDEGCTDLIETLVTDEEGYAKSEKLALGSYYVKEISRPEGYALDTDRVYGPVNITSDSAENVPIVLADDEPLAALELVIYKTDEETGEESQGSAALTGAEFTIDFYPGYYTEAELSSLNPEKSWVIATKEEDGRAAARLDDEHRVFGDNWYYDPSGNIILPLGTYTIRETSAPAGYIIEGEFTDQAGKSVPAGELYCTWLTDDESSRGAVLSLSGGNEYTGSDTVITGGVEIKKRDLQSRRDGPEGAASLEGAVFEITNENENPVIVEGTSYGPGEVVKTLVTDENGYACTAADTLPFGSYKITETSAPAGYLLGSEVLTASTWQSFSIRENGVIVDLTALPDSITDQVKRGDLSFEKQDGENQSTDLGSIPFKITSVTTGESHVIWTDMNGQYSTSSDWNPHTRNTNAGESYEDGVWFYGYADGEDSGEEVRDDLGALPYDTYLIEELRCENNEGRTLVTTRVTIYRDDATVHIGTLDNYAYGFSTTAASTEDGEKYIEASETASITDEIRYWGLDNSKTYTFVTTLFDATAGDLITDEEGEELTIETEFKPRASDGAQDVVFEFDATELSGHTLVVFESLYDEDDEEIESENDGTDEDQSVYLDTTPEEPPEDEPPEEVPPDEDEPEPDEPEVPEETPESPEPTENISTGDLHTTAWIVVVAAASCCLILAAAGQRQKKKKIR